MWQTHGFRIQDNQQLNQISQSQSRVVIGSDGKPQEVLLRVPCNKEIAVIDALNFVVHPETFNKKLDEHLNNPELTDEQKRKHATDTAYHIGNVLRGIMGDDFAVINDTGVSRNRYRYTFRIGHPECQLGMIGIGNFNSGSPSILIMIGGEGCHFADDWWEFSLYNFLTQYAIDARITRCDLAHDDFEGLYSSAELADEADTNGQFAFTNKMPKVQQLGDWKRHEGAGRTLQVGRRENGKCYRGYEKGKQMGNKESPWFRHEVEIGNKARVIPLDILMSPSQYFAGSYPYLHEITQYALGHTEFDVTRIKTVKAMTTISLQKSVEIVRRQFGRYLKVFRDIFADDSEILDLLVTQKQDYYPKRLRLFEKLIFRPPTYLDWYKAPYTDEIPFEPLRKLSYAI